jgi:hypothetical protein
LQSESLVLNRNSTWLANNVPNGWNTKYLHLRKPRGRFDYAIVWCSWDNPALVLRV